MQLFQVLLLVDRVVVGPNEVPASEPKIKFDKSLEVYSVKIYGGIL